MGIWPAEFWKLTFYEWTLCVARIKKLYRDKKKEEELLIELERNSMALFANAYRGQNQAAFRGQDFYKLSYDEIKTESDKAEKITGEALFQKMQERFKGKPLRNGRNGTG